MAQPLSRRWRAVLREAAAPWAARMARRFVAGDRVEDAVRVCQRLRAYRTPSTIGYWNDSEEHPDRVLAACLESIRAIRRGRFEGYLSVKLPALGDDPTGRLHHVLGRAADARLRVHFDSLGPEHADRGRRLIEGGLRVHPHLGCTLPGRWRRSVDDAAWAVDHDLVVRVVKGQWADPDAPSRDARAGFLEVVDAVAGRARRVSVATHDSHVIERALATLRRTETPCELELLYGLPMRRARRIAQRHGVPARVYVPYGASWLPYSMDYVRRHPAVLPWMLLDRFVG